MAWQKSYRGLVESSASVDVYCIGDVLCWLCVVDPRMNSLVLACRGEKQAAVWCKRETSEERCEGLVEVYGSIADTKCAYAAHAG